MSRDRRFPEAVVRQLLGASASGWELNFAGRAILDSMDFDSGAHQRMRGVVVPLINMRNLTTLGRYGDIVRLPKVR